MKTKMLIVGAAAVLGVFAADPSIKDGSVSMTQAASRLVTISYELENNDAIVTLDITTNGVTNAMYKREFMILRKMPAYGAIWRMGSFAAIDGFVQSCENAHLVTFTTTTSRSINARNISSRSAWAWVGARNAPTAT